MRPTRTTQHVLDDDTSPATERVMRAYWLAPRARATRPASVIALLDARAPGATGDGTAALTSLACARRG
jgi:hypothetical protein